MLTSRSTISELARDALVARKTCCLEIGFCLVQVALANWADQHAEGARLFRNFYSRRWEIAFFQHVHHNLCLSLERRRKLQVRLTRRRFRILRTLRLTLSSFLSLRRLLLLRRLLGSLLRNRLR